ncbi:MAG: hypothetical protein QG637_193, partial [Chloroflexota bacterium]|nr:hypothetical protein [Chloroflexota bacterium]
MGTTAKTHDQLELFTDIVFSVAPAYSLATGIFSHGDVCPQAARCALEENYTHLMDETDQFNRQLVSFQTNKTEMLHGWISYREGFSPTLVEMLLQEFGVGPGDVVLDPFAGSCTTLLTARMLGVDATGIELLPNCHLAWEAKSRVFDYDVSELRSIRERLDTAIPSPASEPFPHLIITESAFPEQIERDLMAYAAWIEKQDVSENTRLLWKFTLMSILERVSYTRKDGQYLRWDTRARKLEQRNAARILRGQEPIQGIDKGALPDVKETLLAALDRIISDTAKLQSQPPPSSHQTLIRGNLLTALPVMEADQFAAVITSPPYANRYDYTRTYALELAYLGVGDRS